MDIRIIGMVLAVIMGLASPVVAQEKKDEGGLRHRVEFTFTTPIPGIGYEPATVINDGLDETYIAASAPRRIFRLGGLIAMEGAYGAFDLRPYTDTRWRNGGLQVSVGGLEIRLSSPMTHRFVIGLYHHSSHNFSDGRYGFGTNLNSVYSNVRWWKDSVGLGGDPLAYEFRTEAHVFLTREAIPYVLTDTTVIDPGDDDRSSWRFSAALDAHHPSVRTTPTFTANGENDWRMASGAFDVPITFRLPFWFFGSFREHFYIGPYGTFGWNLYRTERYGEIAWSAGLRMEVVVSDTTR